MLSAHHHLKPQVQICSTVHFSYVATQWHGFASFALDFLNNCSPRWTQYKSGCTSQNAFLKFKFLFMVPPKRLSIILKYGETTKRCSGAHRLVVSI